MIQDRYYIDLSENNKKIPRKLETDFNDIEKNI